MRNKFKPGDWVIVYGKKIARVQMITSFGLECLVFFTDQKTGKTDFAFEEDCKPGVGSLARAVYGINDES